MATTRRSHCTYVKGLLMCVEKRRHGYAGWLYSKGAKAKRLPVSLVGSDGRAPKTLAQAVRNGRTFVRRTRR